jgi:hypothetical protein
MFYVMTIKELPLSKIASEIEEERRDKINNELGVTKAVMKKNGKSGKQWSDWIKEGQFYIFGFVYMFARIALNTTATMMPLYLATVTGFEQKGTDGSIPPQIALVPLCSYVCSLIFSIKFQQPLTQHFRNRLIPLVISTLVTTTGSLPYMFLTTNASTRWLVYPCAAVQGVGIAMMLNTGTSLISDVIG